MVRISRRFQSKTLQRLGCVPHGLRCPRCHHDFEIVVSRRQRHRKGWMRRVLRTYRCRVCDHRFCEWDFTALFRLARAGLLALAGVIAVVSWLAR